MLAVENLQSGYGTTRILFDISLGVKEGEVTALLGRNGMGKTTTIRAVMGLLPVLGGRVMLDGVSLSGMKPFRIAQLGLGLVPEGRQVFPTLTVAENLVATSRPGAWDIARVYGFFPRLRERAGQMARLLSGGEQQMLAIGRALMTNPRLLILDEATEGLAPLVRAEIWACLAQLKRDGLAILLVDKNLDAILQLADQAVIVEKGVTVWAGRSDALGAADGVRERYLHL
jgi:branched-chain amino acid transport system ATP-binding protein